MMGGVRDGIGLIEEPLTAVSLDRISYAVFSDSGSDQESKGQVAHSDISKPHSFIIRPLALVASREQNAFPLHIHSRFAVVIHYCITSIQH
jgi:hypothetical protein